MTSMSYPRTPRGGLIEPHCAMASSPPMRRQGLLATRAHIIGNNTSALLRLIKRRAIVLMTGSNVTRGCGRRELRAFINVNMCVLGQRRA